MSIASHSASIGPPRPFTLALLAIALVVGACATKPPADDLEAMRYYKEINDPLEPMNRQILKFNRGFEAVVLTPIAKTYRAVLPAPARKGVYNILHNLKSPVIFGNDVMQGEGKRAGNTLLRFLVNSTLGIGGLIDVATRMGIESHDEDFGQTLAVHGAGEGFYLVLPIFGPSNPRDGIGVAVDILIDPIFWILRSENLNYVNYIRTAVDGVDIYARNLDEIEDFKRTSLDYYSALRSTYRQNRRSEILNGAEEDPDFPEYLFEDEGEEEEEEEEEEPLDGGGRE
jgi:phospholipid-binding lipoprotein MlaA